MVEYKVYTARYVAERTKYEGGKSGGKVIEQGALDERGTLSASINDELKKLGKGWYVKSISISAVLGDIIFVILFEKTEGPS